MFKLEYTISIYTHRRITLLCVQVNSIKSRAVVHNHHFAFFAFESSNVISFSLSTMLEFIIVRASVSRVINRSAELKDPVLYYISIDQYCVVL